MLKSPIYSVFSAESEEKVVILHIVRCLYRITIMEESKTQYIESSLAAFRAIKTIISLKGTYPRNFSTGFWDEDDYSDTMS